MVLGVARYTERSLFITGGLRRFAFSALRLYDSKLPLPYGSPASLIARAGGMMLFAFGYPRSVSFRLDLSLDLIFPRRSSKRRSSLNIGVISTCPSYSAASSSASLCLIVAAGITSSVLLTGSSPTTAIRLLRRGASLRLRLRLLRPPLEPGLQLHRSFRKMVVVRSSYHRSFFCLAHDDSILSTASSPPSM